ncbi:glycosyltransferase family 2 protein [Nocardioides donggukensis]|uniref:Glycosyltransferase family 2 protein n=1 Tax=Nocardioides donggukensis TaxID=2774019 RepID=A0A927Q0W1_9ACTN|nr:glycosyltransferase family 2 protein [Nocardioides donggukensis]MBD8869387.1 glycosyltransferase family 2 protein [Nocardioides donggukensis]
MTPLGASAPEHSVSVVVCAYTRQRWESLCAVVEAVRRQDRPVLEVLLVIDHAPELLAECRSAFPGVRVLPSSGPRGLSGARNTGVAAARGDVVAFVDDDAVPEADWLTLLLAPYADPRVLAVGGAAHPVWPVRRPAHLVPELDWVVGCSYRGQPVRRARVRNVIGANMSFRRGALDVVGGFDESIGRLGLLPLGCEETELCIRLTQRNPGARIVLEPRSRVRHRVTVDRTRPAYLWRRAYAEGLSKARVTRLVGAGDATSTERRYLSHSLPAAVLRELGRAVTGHPSALAGVAGVVAALLAAGLGYLRGSLDCSGRRLGRLRAREAVA